MKIVFMGTPEFSVPILKKLHEKYPVSLVVTQPDKIVGRKKTLTPPPVKELATELNIPVFQPKKLREDFDAIIEVNPDLIITAAYGQILPEKVLRSANIAAINVHASLLPKLRGGAPIQRAIERMYHQTGVTIMHMSKKMDAGDIIAQEKIIIAPNETSGTLFTKLSYLGADLLLKTLPSLINNIAPRFPQDHEKATYAYNIKKEEEHLDFNNDSKKIEAKIRAFSPNPGTYALIDGMRLKILKASLPKEDELINTFEPGTIVKIEKTRFAVRTKDSIIWIEKVQLAGKKQMDCSVFLLGSGKKLIQTHKVFQ